MNTFQVVFICFIVISVITFATYGIDKYKAQHNKWRISEATLILLAALGGSVAALFAMFVFRHKTKHLKFIVGVPLIFVAPIALISYFWL